MSHIFCIFFQITVIVFNAIHHFQEELLHFPEFGGCRIDFFYCLTRSHLIGAHMCQDLIKRFIQGAGKERIEEDNGCSQPALRRGGGSDFT